MRYFWITSFLWMGFWSSLMAENTSNTIETPLQIANKENFNILDFIAYFIKNVIEPIIPLFVVVAFVWVGFKFVKSQGNPDDISKAKKDFWYVLLGAFMAYVVINVFYFLLSVLGNNLN